MKPVIGITMSGRREKEIVSPHYDTYFTLPAPYVDAVRRGGGVPLLLPPGESNWREWLESVDGVIVSGGTDIQPQRYNGNGQHAHLLPVDPERDESDLSLARHLAQEVRLPSLFICRGMQVLNVALGGTLHAHIPDIVDADIHRGADGDWAIHDINIYPGSHLAQVVDTTQVRAYSGHHQAAKAIAPGLREVATAPDGIVEALEMRDHPWLVAVQWHPETSAADDSLQQVIFDGLVQAAAELKHQRIVARS
jgi:putative glutamine amidotransferase